MKIQDALKETGMAKCRNIIYYAKPSDEKEDNQELRWFVEGSNDRKHAVSLDIVVCDDWAPYHLPEPEPKCPACIRADELNKEYGSSAIADHLREPAPVGHCSCKED